MMQSLPVMAISDSHESYGVVLMTTGLNHNDKAHVMRWIRTLGWTLAADYTCRGVYYTPSLSVLLVS